MGMESTDRHLWTMFASGLGSHSIEWDVVAIAVILFVLLVIIRAKRSRNQKLRRAAGSGFYDFDVARYGHGAPGSSLMETPMTESGRPLAPSFVSSSRDGEAKANPKARGAGGMAPLPVPSSFAAADRSLAGPVPAFDQATAVEHRPPTAEPAAVNLAIPSMPRLPPDLPAPARPTHAGETAEPPPGTVPVAEADSQSSLPLLVQPPPPPPPPPPT